MKKIVFSIFALALASAACSSSFVPGASPTPTSRFQQADDSPTRTKAVQATPTTAPATEAFTVTATVNNSTATPQANLTTTPATATNAPADSTSKTPTQSQAGQLTFTPTMGILTYGTLPPAVPFSKVTLINKSRAQAYISLQNYPANGNVAILEYPVEKRVEIKAPLGYYVYVTWVGGRKITGSFTLHSGIDMIITIYKDKVVVR